MNIVMSDPRVLAALAGICFGFWPMLQNRSGVDGSWATAVMAGIAIVAMIPSMATQGLPSTTTGGWTLLSTAGFIQAIGIFAMASLAIKVPGAELPKFLMIAYVIQACVPPAIQLSAGGMTPWRAAGFVSGAFTIYALTRA